MIKIEQLWFNARSFNQSRKVVELVKTEAKHKKEHNKISQHIGQLTKSKPSNKPDLSLNVNSSLVPAHKYLAMMRYNSKLEEVQIHRIGILPSNSMTR